MFGFFSVSLDLIYFTASVMTDIKVDRSKLSEKAVGGKKEMSLLKLKLLMWQV